MRLRDQLPEAGNADRVALAAGWIALGLFALLLFLIVRPLLTPLAWAAVLATVFYPWHEALLTRWGPSRAAAVTTVAATLIVVVPLLLLTVVFVREAVDAATDLQRAFADGRLAWIDRVWHRLTDEMPIAQRDGLSAIVGDLPRRVALAAAAVSGAVVRNVAAFVFDLVVALFASFFLLRDSEAIATIVRRIVPMNASARERLFLQTRQLVSVTVTSSGIVAALQGLCGGIAFAAVGIQAPVFWGVAMAFFCLLPLGAWVVWAPAAVGLALAGHTWRAVVLAVVGFAVVSAVDNVLRPILLSGRTQMNGLLILVSLLGGAAAFGAIGLVLGPIVMSLAVAFVRTYAVQDVVEYPDTSDRSVRL